MKEKEKLLVLLSQFEITYKKISKIIEILDEELNIDNFLKNKQIKELFDENLYENIKICATDARIKSYLKNLEESEIKLITKFSSEYPEKLACIPDAPYFLFCKGDTSLLNQKAIAIVGSRVPSKYGMIVTDRFSETLAKSGIVIVSGLAYGVDSIAHRKALDVNGKTIAVLGSGFNNIYPSAHQDLANIIASKGLLISEYCPSMKATKYSFPQRNRIIAGLSDGVLITEASIKSGTIHTKDFALDYGKDVFAVPGNINSEKSELPNDIIKSGQGYAVTSPEDILEKVDFKVQNYKKVETVQLSIEEQTILNLLSDGDKDTDFLSKNCNFNVNILLSYLTTLEIRGIIKRLPGGFYSLA